jgi:hypothetical protein
VFVVGDAAGVVEELADGDVAPRRCRDVPFEGIVEADPVLVDELHDDRGDERLGDAADPETGVGVDGNRWPQRSRVTVMLERPSRCWMALRCPPSAISRAALLWRRSWNRTAWRCSGSVCRTVGLKMRGRSCRAAWDRPAARRTRACPAGRVAEVRAELLDQERRRFTALREL